MTVYRPIALSAAFLFLFAVIGAGLVAFTFDSTAEKIADNERRALLESLNELVPDQRYDNDIFNDVVYVRDSELLGTSETGTGVPRAQGRLAGGCSTGAVDLGRLQWADTPAGGDRSRRNPGWSARGAVPRNAGTGDAIEAERSDWILGFSGRSLSNPPAERWKVKRDGGESTSPPAPP